MVYVIVTCREGHVVASRFIEEVRLGAWLEYQPGATAHVYDAAPAMGGVPVRTLHRDGSTREWREVRA